MRQRIDALGFDANDDGQHPPEPSSDAGVRNTTNVTHASFTPHQKNGFNLL
jgi:hypothetical protein